MLGPAMLSPRLFYRREFGHRRVELSPIPAVLSYHPDLYTINYAIPPDLILDLRPDYIVILEIYGRAGLLKEPRFWDSYDLVEKIPTDIYGSDGMLILEKKR
jgi:hypothetical protein